jgi:hypothetical protein
MSQSDKKRAALIVSAITLTIALVLLVFRDWPTTFGTAAPADVPLVMHTSGGRLEVATVDNTESFKLEDAREIFGIPLGTTVSSVQVRVKYRYYIDMAKEWPIRISDGVATVEAGEIKPQLPVAIDTTTMALFTSNGWARFNKYDNLERLERSLSPTLAARAQGYKAIAIEASRKSVSDFVRTWLVKNRPNEGTVPDIRVYFPGEASSGAKVAPAS